MPILRTMMRGLNRFSRREILQFDQWRRRFATLAGALLVGIIAVIFARMGYMAGDMFTSIRTAHPYLPLVMTPFLFVVCAALTQRYAMEAAGSGIPQVIAASHNPDGEMAHMLISVKAASLKLVLSLWALLGGASVGREGPTVQISAAIMSRLHDMMGVRLTSGVYIAGGAAGVAAAFNAPLAGIAFAIEELAVAYEQRVAVLSMGAVMISGLMSQGIAGNYVYFGAVSSPSLPLLTVLIVAPIAGLGGGALGGIFSRLLISVRVPGRKWSFLSMKYPVRLALGCGIIVAILGTITGGSTWGTGYGTAVDLLRGGHVGLDYGFAKFFAVLATSVSGIPGGIFAPSLAVGAGVGNLISPFFPSGQAGSIVLLGMIGYFAGVVRAPLTAVIILSEATGGTSIILPLFLTAMLGDWAGSQTCKERLYHSLAGGYMQKAQTRLELEAAERADEETALAAIAAARAEAEEEARLAREAKANGA